MAARSAVVNFANNTSYTLTLSSTELQHGEWDSQPPNTIAPNSSASWGSESDGFLTGTQGTAVYAISGSGAGQVSVSWDVPYAGGNGYNIAVPSGFIGTYSGGDGQNAVVNFAFSPT